MPFSNREFEAECVQMPTDQLLKEHKHYTKLGNGSVASTAVSAISIPFTFGLSAVSIGNSGPTQHAVKKKRQTIEKILKARGIEGQQAIDEASAAAISEARKSTRMSPPQGQTWGASYAQLSLGTSTLERTADYVDDKRSMAKPDKVAMSLHSNPPGAKARSDSPPSTFNNAQADGLMLDGEPPVPSPAGLKHASSRRGKRQTGYYAPPQLTPVSPPPLVEDDSPGSSPASTSAPTPTDNIPPISLPVHPRLATGGCGPHSNLYPHSCMYSGPHGPDDRQVHFAVGVEYIA